MIKCKKCGKLNQDNAKYCIECGETLEEYNVRCPRCNYISSGNVKICEKCGYRFINLNDYETKTINAIDEENELKEEEYKNEEKNIKKRLYNLKIKEASKDKLSLVNKDEIFEYSEDFNIKESRISSKKMMKYEKKFHQIDLFASLIIILLSLVLSFLPIVSINSSKTQIIDYNFINILFSNWGEIIKEFGYGLEYFGNALAYSYGPILEFLFFLLFFFYNLASLIYALVKGIKDIKRNNFKHSFYLLILPSDILFLFLLSYIGFNEDVLSISVFSIIYLVIINVYLLLCAVYNIIKVYLVKNKTIFIRRILLLSAFLLGIASLIFNESKIIIYDGVNISIYSYLSNLLLTLNENNNLISFYLGFIAYFLYSLNIFFIGLSTYYIYKMIKLYNHFKITSLIFTIFGAILTLFSSILFIISTYYSNLENESSLTIVPILLIVFSLIMLFIVISVVFIFKDEEKNKKKEIKNGE